MDGRPKPQERELPDLPVRLGHALIEAIEPASILTRATGFMADYNYTLNPYSGCSFGCTYCYTAFFSRKVELQDTWGQWVQAKVNTVETLQKKMRKDLTGKRVYMSSVTDPYQPIERRLELVRSLLPILTKPRCAARRADSQSAGYSRHRTVLTIRRDPRQHDDHNGLRCRAASIRTALSDQWAPT